MTVVNTAVGSIHASRHRRSAPKGLTISAALAIIPVAMILTMQAFLSIRHVNAVAASGDEATYIYSGHQLIHELWHGGGSPSYETWFPSSPVIYPILAAILDYIGGLALVRLMSCVFMLAVTGLLYTTTRHLFGYWPAITATGLFALLGITQGIGINATFCAMSLMLMSFAAYSAVRAVDGTKWLLAIPIVLLAANATNYSSAPFDPVVIALAAFVVQRAGWRRVWQRIATLTFTTAALITISVVLAGTAYRNGIVHTMISIKPSSQAANLQSATSPAIIEYSWDLIGLAICGVLAIIAAITISRERALIWPLVVLVMVPILVTLEVLRVVNAQLIIDFDDLGAWFAAIPAGYAFARCAELTQSSYKRILYLLPALASIVIIVYSYGSFSLAGIDYGTAGEFGPIIPYLKVNSSDRYLLGSQDSRAILYDYHLTIPWQREFDDDNVEYPIPGRTGEFLTGSVGAEAAILAHWFAVVSFVGQSGLPIDPVELDAVRVTPGYKLISNIGGPTYIYAPDYTGLTTKAQTAAARTWFPLTSTLISHLPGAVSRRLPSGTGGNVKSRVAKITRLTERIGSVTHWNEVNDFVSHGKDESAQSECRRGHFMGKWPFGRRRHYDIGVCILACAAVLSLAAMGSLALGRNHAVITSFRVPFRPPYVPALDPLRDAQLGLTPNSTLADPKQSPTVKAIEVFPHNIDLILGTKRIKVLSITTKTISGVARRINNGAWIRQTGTVITIAGSLIVEPGATIMVAAPRVKTVRLLAGASIGANSAHLTFNGVHVVSWDKANPINWSSNKPRPSVLAENNAVMTITNSTFSNLGWDWNGAYGVSWTNGATGAATDSTFKQNFIGLYTAHVSGLRFDDDSFFENKLYGLDPHSGSANLTIVDDIAEDNAGHGIIFSDGVIDSVISGCISRDNHENGIMMDADSAGNTIRENVVYGNAGDGIVLSNSPDNKILFNRIYHNRIGVHVAHGSPTIRTVVKHNLIEWNEVAFENIDLPPSNVVENNGGQWELKTLIRIWGGALILLFAVLALTWCLASDTNQKLGNIDFSQRHGKQRQSVGYAD